MREIVIDTETTGLSYKTGDRVIEVGCVELINHVATNKSLQFYCKVDKEISEGAQRITGITNKFLSEADLPVGVDKAYIVSLYLDIFGQ